MKGTALIFTPDSTTPTEGELLDEPSLKFLQGAVGGRIELVPYFTTIEHDGEMHECVAFCNQEGKLEGEDVNVAATQAWERACPQLRRRDGSLADVLVGSIVVLYGDEAFMRSI